MTALLSMTAKAAAVSFALSLAVLAGCETTAAAGAAGAQLSQPTPVAEAEQKGSINGAVIARRCPNCGWIQSKREILPPVAHAPPVYEYTVRMADGSSRIFLEELAWRVGERLVLIAGTGPPN